MATTLPALARSRPSCRAAEPDPERLPRCCRIRRTIRRPRRMRPGRIGTRTRRMSRASRAGRLRHGELAQRFGRSTYTVARRGPVRVPEPRGGVAGGPSPRPPSALPMARRVDAEHASTAEGTLGSSGLTGVDRRAAPCRHLGRGVVRMAAGHRREDRAPPAHEPPPGQPGDHQAGAPEEAELDHPTFDSDTEWRTGRPRSPTRRGLPEPRGTGPQPRRRARGPHLGEPDRDRSAFDLPVG